MSSTTTQPKAIAPSAFETELTKMDQGVQQSLPAGTLLTINGTAMKQAAIDQQLQSWITTFQAVETAKKAYQEAVAARLAITVDARTFYKQLKVVLKSYFGTGSAVLATFGISADKAITTTAQAKVVAAAKRAQTRAVRGTKGKKQKAALTVVGNPPVALPSTGKQQISPPPVNVGEIGGGSGTPSSTGSSTPASTAAPSTPAPAASGTGGSTPSTGGNTPAAGA